jgi:tRNA threonylcarbamoyl adenosine modification protein YjeE
MTHRWTVQQADEAAIRRLAEAISLKLRPGDTLSLAGDLGAGKTTFARALVRALLDDDAAEVPSPTFSIVQTYDTLQLAIAHLDLYRLASEDELDELGIEDMRSHGALVVEWAERAPSILGPDRLDIELAEGGEETRRNLTLTGHGTWSERLARLEAMLAFLDREPWWRSSRIHYLQGDASARAYARLTNDRGAGCGSSPGEGEGTRTALLMDWPRQPDGPPIRNGLPYSRIAHLAEDVSAFTAVAGLLSRHGFAAPAIHAADLDHGFLVLENLGEHVFGHEIAAGQPMRALWRDATDVLVAVRAIPGEALVAAPVGFGSAATHAIPAYDAGAMAIETELVLDWYWPMTKGASAPRAEYAEAARLWAALFPHVLAHRPCLVLRDYHSPNLIVLANRGPDAKARVGLIDFQDAMQGHPAYDLVSLLQDARLDVPADIEAELLDHYCRATAEIEPCFDADAFRLAYAILGAQRNTKILGIFARLAKRDGKRAYLAHIPRIWRYLERNLSHPSLAALAGWYDASFPGAVRAAVPPG